VFVTTRSEQEAASATDVLSNFQTIVPVTSCLSGVRRDDAKEPVHGRTEGEDPVRGRPSSVTEVVKRNGISEQTLYAWRKMFGDLEVGDTKRIRSLESENARLKKLLAERDLEIEVMKEIAAKKW
jgi:putative transposase